jgi:hypothetical protein
LNQHSKEKIESIKGDLKEKPAQNIFPFGRVAKGNSFLLSSKRLQVRIP